MATPVPVPVLSLSLALSLALAGGPAARAQALYAGPDADPAFTDVAPELAGALDPVWRLQLTAVPGPDAALDKLLGTPGALAVTDLATLADYAARHALPAGRLVFAGEVTRRCLVVFVQKGGWVHSLGELEGAGGAPPPTLGLVGSDAVAAFDLLRRLDGALAGVAVSQGAAGPLAAQVARGTLDGLLIVAYPDLAPEALRRLADNDRLARVAVVTRRLARAVATGEGGFTLAQATGGGMALPWQAQPEPALCSPLGVVARDDTPAALRDALPSATRAAMAVLRKPDLAERAGRAAHVAIDAVRGWFADP